MKYADSQEVKMGDRVKLGDDAGGVVVCSMDTNEYTDEYPKVQWGYLQKGVMILFPQFGLIHYENTDPDLELLSRE